MSTPSVDSATRSTLSDLLKNVYEPDIRDNVAFPSALWAQVKKTSRDIVEGSKVIVALRLGLSQAVGARSELASLPLPQRSPITQSFSNLKYIYGVMRVSGPLMASSKTDAAAFKRAIDSEVNGIKDSLKIDMARQCFNDGVGTLTATGVTTASTTLQLDANANMLYFFVGMMIDIYNASDAIITNGTSREVMAIDNVNKTLTLDSGGGNVTTAATGYITRNGSRANEISGLAIIVKATSSLQNVDPATAGAERWASTVDTGFGAFDEIKFQEHLDAIHTASGKWPDMAFSQSGPRNQYLKTLVQQRRFVGQPPTSDLKGGFKGLSYTGGEREMAWVKDSYVPSPKSVYSVNMEHLELRRAFDFRFMEIDGSAWLPEIYGSSGVDAYKAVIHSYVQLVTDRRNAHGRIDVTLPT